MKTNSYEAAQRIFNNYLEQNNCRKTPERFAVLEAVYGFNSYFSIQNLNDKLTEMNFPVSRATLYNTIKLMMGLHLVSCQRLQGENRYKTCGTDNRCVQICTMCGKSKEIKVPEIADVYKKLHLKRFRKESFFMSIYGTCSTCQAKLTRLKNKEKTKLKE